MKKDKRVQLLMSDDDKEIAKEKAGLRGFDSLSAYIRYLIRNDKN